MRKAGNFLHHFTPPPPGEGWTQMGAKCKGRWEECPLTQTSHGGAGPSQGCVSLHCGHLHLWLIEREFHASHSKLSQESGRCPDGHPSPGSHDPWQVLALHADFPVSDPSITCSLPSPAGGLTQSLVAPGAKVVLPSGLPGLSSRQKHLLSTCFLSWRLRLEPTGKSSCLHGACIVGEVRGEGRA